MAEKRGRGRGRAAGRTISEPEVVVLDGSDSDPSLSASQLARLRQRWELASVLNFLHVFEPLIQSDLKMSAEEIEMALISPNDALARIHIALLKGILPVNKNLREPDAWVTTVCKKLDLWWPWVAEGENPLKVNHGEEKTTYKKLDPTIRLLMLKALCEVRAYQDDILRYITDELKAGTKITAFRKEKICSGDNGVGYWYDGDPIIGYRLYREVVKVDFKQKWKGKGRLTQPTIDFRWETLATNLEEFRELSESLSSKITSEAAVGEMIKIEIIPSLEELQKKKERALKRQQRQAMLLDNFLHSSRTGKRSRRERRPVSYTFDEYDRSIDEAIQMSKKSNTNKLRKDRGNGEEHVSGQNGMLEGAVNADTVNTTSDSQTGDDDKYRGRIGGDDAEDDDYDQKGNEHAENSGNIDNNFHLGDSDKENMAIPRKKRLGPAQNKNEAKPKAVGVSRSRRTADHGNPGRFLGETTGHVETKKRLKQRPTRNAGYVVPILPESEDNLSEDEKQAEEVSGTEKEPVSSGDESQVGNGETDDE